MRNAIFAGLACGGVIAAVTCGFAFTGSPAIARLQAFDAQRVEDLSDIAATIDRGQVGSDPLPPSLERYRNSLGDEVRDPQTHEPYTYVRERNGKYRLCADFATSETEYFNKWLTHHAGRQCFERNARSG